MFWVCDGWQCLWFVAGTRRKKLFCVLKNDCDKITCCNELKMQLSRDENIIMIVNVVWCRSWKGSADADVTRTFLQLFSDDLSNTANFTKLHRTLRRFQNMSQILLRFLTVTHYVAVIVDFEENFPRFFPGSHPSLNQPHRFIKASSWPSIRIEIIIPSSMGRLQIPPPSCPEFWQNWRLLPPRRPLQKVRHFDPGKISP